MGATYILYADYYAISCQWSKTKIAYFANPAEMHAWMVRAGFEKRESYFVYRGRNSERYVLAVARTAHLLTTMSYHADRMLQWGGDDFAISMAHQCEKDVKRWVERARNRGTAVRADDTECRGTAIGASRLPLRALAESAGLPCEGAGRWPD